jgi:L-threonylcarbamoyladenylate synthase
MVPNIDATSAIARCVKVERMWLKSAVEALHRGQIVAVATESYFALAGDARSSRVLDDLISLKGRDAYKGIGLLASPGEWRQLFSVIPPLAERLVEHFWPGPLTLVLPASRELDPRLVVQDCVGVRVPGPSNALELVRAWGGPLTATSANLAGQPPCRTAAELRAVFGEQPMLHVVDGDAPGGQVSTLLRLTSDAAEVLRPGAVSEEVLTPFLVSRAR